MTQDGTAAATVSRASQAARGGQRVTSPGRVEYSPLGVTFRNVVPRRARRPVRVPVLHVLDPAPARRVRHLSRLFLGGRRPGRPRRQHGPGWPEPGPISLDGRPAELHPPRRFQCRARRPGTRTDRRGAPAGSQLSVTRSSLHHPVDPPPFAERPPAAPRNPSAAPVDTPATPARPRTGSI